MFSLMKRIAVVEDNEDNRLLIQAILGERFEVTEYNGGAQALEGIRAHPPDLVLLDVSLPGMDGTEVLAKLRADPQTKALTVVALTAHAMAGDRERFLAAGFDHYLSKPIVDHDELVATVERLVTSSA